MLTERYNVTELPNLRSFCDSFELAFLLLSPNLTILENNKHASHLFACEPSLMQQRLLPEFCDLHKQSCPMVCKPDHIDLRRTHHCVDSQQYETQWYLSSVYSEEGELLYYALAGKYMALPQGTVLQHSALHQFIDSFKMGIYWKSSTGDYVDANSWLCHVSGHKHLKFVSGRSDYEMAWESTAAQLRDNDTEVMASQQAQSYQEYVNLADDRAGIMLSTKQPCHDMAGNVVGVVGISVNMATLQRNRGIKDEHLQNACQQWSTNDVHLTGREMECVNWLLRGKSAAEIASIMQLSKRTIETHINHIKSKLGSYKQFQLGYMLAKYGALIM